MIDVSYGDTAQEVVAENCALSMPREREARERFRAGLVALLTDPGLKREAELIRFMGCLKWKT